MEKNPAKKIVLSDYDILQTIGTGSFGRVKLCKQKRGCKFQALKILKKNEILRLKQVDHIMSEITILAEIDHPFQIKIPRHHQSTGFPCPFCKRISGDKYSGVPHKVYVPKRWGLRC